MVAGVDDELRVRRVLEAYFFAVDAQQRQTIRDCFREEARATLHFGTRLEQTLTGADSIAERIFKGCKRFDASNHTLSNLKMEIAGSKAAASTFAIAHVVIGTEIQVRGLRYDDVLVCEHGIWRIDQRLHTPRWQYNAAAILPELN
ncbi:MAG: nuclear transport factor 2 family protein [Rhodobiaceae bacterium]|nr:nuclear transport factor 2 family protein [Rhodobiaceae bacterium]